MTDESTIAAPCPAPNPPAPKADCESGLNVFASMVRRFSHTLADLESAAKPLHLEPLAGRDWFDLLTRKLLPQLADGAYLIVAVVGGTNIGKSVVFNHIAGFRASASSPLASGTKHPVCLVPTGFAGQHDLRAMFPAFELRSWTSGDEALLSIDTHCLFWREHECVPKNLVILDTPDVDSDAPMNWHRADAVRQAADVLVAVLTQQKYNDAAVKQFFRKAAAEDKAAIIVFNQVELPDDEPYWPIWLNTFCGETGLQPEYVYLAPNDRKAAEAIALTFEERAWVKKDGSGQWAVGSGKELSVEDVNTQKPPAIKTVDPASWTSPQSPLPTPHSLASVLSQLRFAEIKLRTLRGSIARLVDEKTGVPAYLREVRVAARRLQSHSEVYEPANFVRGEIWREPPTHFLVKEMWSWWDQDRDTFTKWVHGAARSVWTGLKWGMEKARLASNPPPSDDFVKLREYEWDGITKVVGKVFMRLREDSASSNDRLQLMVLRLLDQRPEQVLLDDLKSSHKQSEFAELARRLVDAEMTALKVDQPLRYQMLKRGDQVGALLRTVSTLSIPVTLGVDQLIVNLIAVPGFAGLFTAVAVGEAAIQGTGGWFKETLKRLAENFKTEREAWLLAKLREHLLGSLLDELQAGANVPEAAAFGEVEAALGELTSQLNDSAG